MSDDSPGILKSQSRQRLLNLSNWLPTLDRSEQAVIYGQMRGNSRADADFYVMILLSSTIAFFGLLQDSVAVIIGAMLVAPLMSPMIAIAHSIVMGNLPMFRRAALSTLSGMVLAIAAAALMTAFLPYIGLIPASEQIIARTQPNLLDQYIALASGAAAAYALSRKGVAAALPGVAIAAALVPPLCVVGYGLGSYQLEMAWGALLLFLTNLAAIVFASAAVFMLLGFRPTRVERNEHVRRGVAVAVIGMVFVTVPLAIATVSSVKKLETGVTVKNTLGSLVSSDVADIRDITIDFEDGRSLIEFTAYPYSESSSEAQSLARRQRIMHALDKKLRLELDEPFAIRALIIDSQQQMASSAEQPAVTPPQVKKGD